LDENPGPFFVPGRSPGRNADFASAQTKTAPIAKAISAVRTCSRPADSPERMTIETREVLLPAETDREDDRVDGDGQNQQGVEDGHQPSSRVHDQPDLPIVFGVTRLCDVAHCIDLSKKVKTVLPPRIGGDDEQVSQSGQTDERGVGHFELLVEFFGLLIGKTGKTCHGLGLHCGFGVAAALDLGSRFFLFSH